MHVSYTGLDVFVASVFDGLFLFFVIFTSTTIVVVETVSVTITINAAIIITAIAVLLMALFPFPIQKYNNFFSVHVCYKLLIIITIKIMYTSMYMYLLV